jgi:hypothetical protein
VAFHFHYINPNYPSLPDVMRSLMPAGKRDTIKMEDIPCTGPAPTMIRRTDLVPLMDEYERIAAAIEADPVAKEKLGWVREMYAYDLAAAVIGVKHTVQDPGETIMIAQPPADANMGKASMYHYTWGAEYFKDGQKVWSWDKRPYVETKHVRAPGRFKPELPPDDGPTGAAGTRENPTATLDARPIRYASLRSSGRRTGDERLGIHRCRCHRRLTITFINRGSTSSGGRRGTT